MCVDTRYVTGGCCREPQVVTVARTPRLSDDHQRNPTTAKTVQWKQPSQLSRAAGAAQQSTAPMAPKLKALAAGQRETWCESSAQTERQTHRRPQTAPTHTRSSQQPGENSWPLPYLVEKSWPLPYLSTLASPLPETRSTGDLASLARVDIFYFIQLISLSLSYSLHGRVNRPACMLARRG